MLASLDEDAFGLGDVVDEVVALCETVPVPASLAIYGSWGSGKSSLANLLASHFKRGKGIAFARFDAFKYAEFPLRRHFLSQVAEAFNITNKEFKEGLYQATRAATLNRRGGWKLALSIIVAATLGAVALATFASLVVAALSNAKGSFSSHFSDAWRASVPGVVLTVPFLAAVIGLVSRYVTIDTTTEAPSSEEQFERLFRKLVQRILKKTGRKRIVIFIDELDRCSSKEVVSTLETLRTFLDVAPCIIIVAADQQALERALTDGARQETPFNPTNPYYSAGSAYLDKIFQYQLPLPPILSRRLSRFALDLIEGRDGIWASVDNRAELVSVLIPTHVHSPRRVKALLNSFALLFRLALKRAADGLIDKDVKARASEVAKLVCLKTEFPLFADDLQLDARLPDLVFRIAELRNEGSTVLAVEELKGDFPGLTEETLTRAKEYAGEKRAVDEVIAQESIEPAATSVASTDREQEVRKSQAKQLLRYLEKTSEITTPRRDLIYLEGSGAVVGLQPQLADQLERDAVDGQADAVANQLGTLDEADQQKAYRLLARLIVEAPGVEARNVVRALFRALSVRKGDLAPIAEDLLNALVKYGAGYELDREDLRGALELALADERLAAQEMRAAVLERNEAIEDDDLALFILENSPSLRHHSQRLATVFGGVLGRVDGEAVAAALKAVADEEVLKLVAAASPDRDEVAHGLGEFIEATKAQQRGTIAIAALARLLGADGAVAADTARDLVGSFSPVEDASLAQAIIERARVRPVVEWPTWLRPIDTAIGKSDESLRGQFDDYVRLLWQARSSPEPPHGSIDEDQFSAAAQELGRLRPDQMGEPVDLLDEATVSSDSEFPTRKQEHASLWELSDANVLDSEEVALHVLKDLQLTLASAAPSYNATGRDAFVLEQWCGRCRRSGSPITCAGSSNQSKSPLGSKASLSKWPVFAPLQR